jgi:hypothetical protein
MLVLFLSGGAVHYRRFGSDYCLSLQGEVTTKRTACLCTCWAARTLAWFTTHKWPARSVGFHSPCNAFRTSVAERRKQRLQQAAGNCDRQISKLAALAVFPTCCIWSAVTVAVLRFAMCAQLGPDTVGAADVKVTTSCFTLSPCTHETHFYNEFNSVMAVL